MTTKDGMNQAMTTKPKPGEARRQARMAARKMLGLSRMDVAWMCGWRGDSRVANAERHGTPFEDQARAIFYHLSAEARRQGKELPITLDIYL